MSKPVWMPEPVNCPHCNAQPGKEHYDTCPLVWDTLCKATEGAVLGRHVPTSEGDMKRYRFRSAVTGRYVTRAYAKRWPRLTVREAVK